MLISADLPFVKNYVKLLNEAIKSQAPGKQLTTIQCYWLAFVVLGVLVTNTLCWSRFARFSNDNYTPAAICWMFKKAKIAWELLLYASVQKLLETYGIKSGILVIDDTDSERSKNTSQIAKVHKIRDKKRAGFFNGQNIVFLLLVTDKLTIPVGFEFYEPDPALHEWQKQDEMLRKKGVTKKYRPIKPQRNVAYPSKITLGIQLVKEFVEQFGDIKIKAVIADTAYGSKDFFENASELTKNAQVISQMKKNQLINVNGKFIRVDEFFKNYSGKTEVLTLRYDEKIVNYVSAKFKVQAHEKRLRIVAIKYENEDEYRYIIANDPMWLGKDIIQAYACRWLVEVFIQDWKSYEGWEQMAMQRGLDGAEHGIIISLLSDHALHFHQEQLNLYDNKGQAATVGSLREKVMMESLTNFIEKIITSDNPKGAFDNFSSKISELFQLRSSTKHLRFNNTDRENIFH